MEEEKKEGMQDEAQSPAPEKDPELNAPAAPEKQEETPAEPAPEPAPTPEPDASAPEQKQPGVFDNKWVRIGVIAAVGLAVVIIAWLLLRPRLVVAQVNGETVTRLDMLRELEQQAGQSALDNLITDILIMQAAESEGVTVSQADVQKEIDTLKGQLEAQGQSFDQYLASQGISQEFMAERLRLRLLVGKLLEERAAVTEQDVDDFIEENAAQLPEDVDPSDETFRAQVRNQLKQQKFSQIVSAYVQELRDDADITYFREY